MKPGSHNILCCHISSSAGWNSPFLTSECCPRTQLHALTPKQSQLNLGYSPLHLHHHLSHHFPGISWNLPVSSHHCNLWPIRMQKKRHLPLKRKAGGWRKKNSLSEQPSKRDWKIHLHPQKLKKSSQPLDARDCCEERIARTWALSSTEQPSLHQLHWQNT